MISSGQIDWPKLIADGERLGIALNNRNKTSGYIRGRRVVIRQLNALKYGVSEIRHRTRVSFRTSLGVQTGGYRCTPTLDSHWGEVMILRAQWVG